MLTERGRLLPDGGYGAVVVRVGGLRVAGYSDPFERRRADGYRARREPEVDRAPAAGVLANGCSRWSDAST